MLVEQLPYGVGYVHLYIKFSVTLIDYVQNET